MIRVLDSFVADKIAAGEVIERPVSAVKELIENSIDAGAGSVIVEIRGGGKSLIRVTDDGCGIEYDEAETAFLRHATSKISGIGDLDRIGTLGFRGEALASISAVSRLTLVTKSSDPSSGIRLVMHGGRKVSSERTGANRGTTMIVEDLFYNTPARRKFMKSDAREASAVIELVQQFAVCYTSIRFMMISNGQTVFTTSGDGSVQSVIASLYPGLNASKLIPLSGEHVSGFVSDPGSTHNSRKYQLFYVNGRPVSSPVIEKALTDGYEGRIFSGFPAAFLFIEADPREIDVNIHPGKREIRFLRQDEIKAAVSDAVREAVMTERGIPSAVIRQPEPDLTDDSKAVTAAPASEQPSIRDYLKNLSRDSHEACAAENKTVPVYNIEADDCDSVNSPAEHNASGTSYVSESHEIPESFVSRSEARPFDFEDLSLRGYVFDTYIIMQNGDDLFVFDQHAAHERVFYEKFMSEYNSTTHTPQPILTPFTINVSADVYCTERDWMEDLIRFGYDIEDFGDRMFIIRGIPSYMTAEEAEGFVKEFAEAAEEYDRTNRIVIDKLIMRSCKSAVKANDRLSETEIGDLIRKLSECVNPYSCPHGRPTFNRISRYDIERSFKRK